MELKPSTRFLEAAKDTNQGNTIIEMSKKRIYKNVVIIGFAFLFLFSAYSSLAVLQSTVNKDGGLGTLGLAITYCSLIISSLFLPSFLLSHLGDKWTIALSMICYIVYMVANMHAAPYTIYPASVIIGIGAAPLWSAKCTYITRSAMRYAEMTNKTQDAIVNLFFGVFFMLQQSAGIWGNVISSAVLWIQPQNISRHQLETCGPNFCPGSLLNNTNIDRPSDTKMYILVGGYFTSAVIGFFLIVLFLDNIKIKECLSDTNSDIINDAATLRPLWKTVVHLWKSTPQKLLVPLTIYKGAAGGFFSMDFTRSYIACSAGLWNVGYVMISFAVVNSVCCLMFGKLVHHVGHVAFFILGAATHMSLLIALLLWQPTPSTFHILFVVAGLWGLGDAVCQTQINALYGLLFSSNSEAAFSNMRLWSALGRVVMYASGSYLCTNVKLYICIGLLVVGMMGYGSVEVLQCRKNKDATNE